MGDTEHNADGQDAQQWLSDPDMMVFSGEEELPVGASVQHSLGDVVGNLFGRSRQDIQRDWEKVLDQIQFLLEHVSSVAPNYEMREVSFELGFSAEGQIVFVAKAGVQTTIKATFVKKGS